MEKKDFLDMVALMQKTAGNTKAAAKEIEDFQRERAIPPARTTPPGMSRPRLVSIAGGLAVPHERK